VCIGLVGAVLLFLRCFPTGTAMGVMGAHAIMGAMSGDKGGDSGGGGGGGGGQAAPQQYDQNPCAFEMQKFMECANSQSNLDLCTAFNDQLKTCKYNNGL
jgi:hypothetical protein